MFEKKKKTEKTKQRMQNGRCKKQIDYIHNRNLAHFIILRLTRELYIKIYFSSRYNAFLSLLIQIANLLLHMNKTKNINLYVNKHISINLSQI